MRVASNLPISSDGSSTFSVGRSSMGIKSLSALAGRGVSSCLGAVSAWAGFFSSAAVVAGEAVFSFFFVSASGVASLAFFSSVLTLRGRPGLRFTVPVLSSVAAFSVVGWAATAEGALMVGASFGLGLLSSPFVSAENTLSTLSFLTVTRDLFWRSFLRSSFCFSAATFFVAPTMACSSRIL